MEKSKLGHNRSNTEPEDILTARISPVRSKHLLYNPFLLQPQRFTFNMSSNFKKVLDSSVSRSNGSLGSARKVNIDHSLSFYDSPVSTTSSSKMPVKSGRSETDLKLEVYSQLFDDIISQDTVYGNLLVKVKNNYEDYIKDLKAHISNLTAQVEIKAAPGTDFEKLEKLEKINQEFIAKIDNLENQVKSMKTKEKKYIKLINLMRKQGHPVEEVYKKYVKSRNQSPKFSNPVSENEILTASTYKHDNPTYFKDKEACTGGLLERDQNKDKYSNIR